MNCVEIRQLMCVEAVARHLQGTPMAPTLFFKAASFPPEGDLKPLR